MVYFTSYYVKKTFQFTGITVCKGDMNHRKPKMAKIILRLNLGLYHHVLNRPFSSVTSTTFVSLLSTWLFQATG